jgi:hypothetical protein
VEFGDAMADLGTWKRAWMICVERVSDEGKEDGDDIEKAIKTQRVERSVPF